VTNTDGRGKRVALYIRVSTDEQAKEGYSVRAQRARLNEWVEREGFRVVEEIADEGFRGRDANRKGIRRIIELAAAGEIDAVLTWKRDRMFRSLRDRLNKEYILREYGARLLATDDTGNRIADTVLDAVAEQESERIRERTQEGMTRKVQEGKVIRGMKAPYGFRASEDGNALVVFDPEMEVVRRILYMVGAEGMSAHSTAKTLNDEGVKSPLVAEAERKGKVLETVPMWSQNTIRNLVYNDLYRPHAPHEVARLVTPEVAATLEDGKVYGLWTWNRRKTTKKLLEDGETYSYRAEVRPEEEWLRVPVDITDARIERGWVDGARHRLKQRRVKPSKAAGRLWPLRGLVRCPECGSVLSPVTVTGKRADGSTARTFYYTCRRRFNNSPRDCKQNKHYRAEALEAEVWGFTIGKLSNPREIVAGLDKRIEQERAKLGGDPSREESHWLNRIADLDRRVDRLQDAALDALMEDGVVQRDRLKRKLRELAEQREAAERELSACRGRGEHIRRLEDLREFYAGEMLPDLLENKPEWAAHIPDDVWRESWQNNVMDVWDEKVAEHKRRELEKATPEHQRERYDELMLRLTVEPSGGFRATGVFGEDVPFVSQNDMGLRR
jgi:site-specific DNA recombinase